MKSQISYSRVKSVFNPIDETVLKFMTPYTNQGKDLMRALENDFLFGDMNIDETYTLKEDQLNIVIPKIKDIINAYGDKIINVELLFESEDYKGYIDMVGEKFIYEIKLRSNTKIDLDAINQIEWYKSFIDKEYKLIIVDRKTNEVVVYSEADIGKDLREKAQAITYHIKELKRLWKK